VCPFPSATFGNSQMATIAAATPASKPASAQRPNAGLESMAGV